MSKHFCQMRTSLGIDGPIEVELRAEVLDEPLLDIEIPTDLREAIGSDTGASETFGRLPPSRQKEFVFNLDEAKRPAAREARVRKSVAVLRRGRHLWEDPAACSPTT